MKEYSNKSRKPMMAGGSTMGMSQDIAQRAQKPRVGAGGASAPQGMGMGMMYGGTSRKKMQDGGSAMANADIQSRVATGRATASDKKAMQKQRREELGRMSVSELRKIANGNDSDAMIARSVLREKGDKGAMPPGDQQPAGKMYGGMSKKKMK
jgi:hypothetical protein